MNLWNKNENVKYNQKILSEISGSHGGEYEV
jgi:hypothetical protein